MWSAVRVVFALAAVNWAQASGAPSKIQTSSLVRLRGHEVELHLAAASSHTEGPLIVYTTGDGGYPGQPPLFDLMAAWGYPMAAVSALDWIDTINDTPNRAIEPGTLAGDYLVVLDSATSALKLPRTTPAVLVGFSRGAAFIVAAATDARLRTRISGLVAVALPRRDEYTCEPCPKTAEAAPPFNTFESLPRIGAMRVALIQSTRDEIMPAAEAQARFGPNSSTRSFHSIDAADHDFGGRQAELVATIKMSLDWVRR